MAMGTLQELFHPVLSMIFDSSCGPDGQLVKTDWSTEISEVMNKVMNNPTWNSGMSFQKYLKILHCDIMQAHLNLNKQDQVAGVE